MKRFLLAFPLLCIGLMTAYGSTLEVLKETFESGLPSTWTQEYVQLPVTQSGQESLYSWSVESSDSLLYPAGCVSGNHRVTARNTTNQEMRFVTRLISPVVNLSGVYRPQISFWHAEPSRASFGDTLRVYYRNASNEPWRPLNATAYTRNNKWSEEVIGLISPSSTYQVAFEISENMGRGVVLDDIVFRSTPTCMAVENIVCSNIHAYDVTLSWDAFGSYNEFQVIVADTLLDMAHIDESHVVARLDENVYDPSAFVNGLTPETQYYVYVRSDCDENDSGYTEWVQTTFRTLKVAYLPYTEDFNSTIPVLQANSTLGLPDGWTIGNSMDTILPVVVRSGNNSNNVLYSIDASAYLGFVGETGTLISAIPASEYMYAATPEIVASSLNGLQVQFWLTAGDFVSLGTQTYAGQLIVGTMSDPANFRTFTPIDTVEISSTSLFKHVCVTLSNYTGTDKFVALVSRSSIANAVFVDNFSMSIPTAAVPEVHLRDIHSTGFTLVPTLFGASSWDFKVSTEYNRNGEVSASSVLVEQSNLSAPQYTVSDVSLADQIVHVYARTHQGDSISAWSFAHTIRIPSAMPALTDSTSFVLSFENGNTLQLNQLDNESRINSTYKGVSSVYYPLLAADNVFNTHPISSSSQPNYQGAHLQLCGIDSWFVLPEAENVSELKMVFRHASQANLRGMLEIGVMTDPYDLSTFEHIATFDVEGTKYNRCLTSFDGYTGTGRYIAFRSVNAGSGVAASTNLIDEIVVSLLGDCREASNVTLEPHADHAMVTWNGGGMTGWIVGLSTQKNMLNATYAYVTTPQYTFTGLDAETQYYYTIQTICGTDTLDLDDVLYSFTTPRGLPLIEEFSSSSLPSGWKYSSALASNIFSGSSMSSSSYSSYWSMSSSSSYIRSPQTGYVAYFNMTSSYAYGWLISPELYVDADPDKPLELIFDLAMCSYAYSYSYYTTGETGPNDQFLVAVSEDGGNTWLRSNATVWNNDGTGDYTLNDLTWDVSEQVKIDFSRYIGKRIMIGFYAENRSSYYNYLSIDNITLRVGDERCGGLKNLTAFTPTTTSATATWQLAGQNPWPALVQLSQSSSFATLIASDTIQGNTISYSDLSANTGYYIRARQLCANDGEWKRVNFRTPCSAITPDAFGEETFDLTDALSCWSTGFTAPRDRGMEAHQTTIPAFGGVMEISKTSTDTTTSDGAYAITPELQLEDGKDIRAYQIIFKAGTNNQSATNVHRLKVGIVTDPTDVSYTWRQQADINLQYAADSSELKTYVVSFENYIGDFDGEMGRYVMFLSEASTDSTNYILIDDVMLSEVEHCHMVLDMSADSITVDGARLHWTGNGNAYEVCVSATRVRPDTCTNWLFHETVSANFCHVTGLAPTTTYYTYIRALCDDDETSRWSSASYFTTIRGVPFEETFDAISSLSENDYRAAPNSSNYLTNDSLTFVPTTSAQWTIDNTSSSSYSRITGISGKIAKMNIYGQRAYWLILPTLDVSTFSAADTRLIFSAKVALCRYSDYSTPATSTDDRLGVLVSRDGGNTWYKRDATFWSSDGKGDYAYSFGMNAQKIEVDMSDYIGGSLTVALYGESTVSNADNWLIVDSLSIQPLSTRCMGVQNATFAMVDNTHACAKWNIVGTPAEVEYELSADETFATIVSSGTTSNDSVVFSNFDYNETYYLRLTQEGCSNSTVLTLTTPYAAPYTQAFAESTLPSDWKMLRGTVANAIAGTLPTESTSSNGGWSILTSDRGLPANHLVGELHYQSSSDVWMVSPDIYIPEGSAYVRLLFDAALTAHNAATAPSALTGHEFRVLVSTDFGRSWKAADQWLFSEATGAYQSLSSIGITSTRISLPMDAYVGQSVRVAFYKASSSSGSCDLHIANMQLREVGEPCDTPTDVAVTDVQFTQATVTWGSQEEKVCVVEWDESPNFYNAKSATISDGAMSYTIDELQSGATYYVRVQQICGANSMSDYTDAITFTTPLGVPYSNSLSSMDGWLKYSSPIANDLAGARTLITDAKGWKTSNNKDILNGDHIYCGNNSNNIYWIVSPQIDLTPQAGMTDIGLSVDLALTKAYNNNTAPSATNYATLNSFYIAVSTDDGATFARENAWEFSASTTADFTYGDIPIGEGQTYSMNFGKFAGQKVRIAFVSKATKAAAINVANLNLDIVTSSCYGVSNVVATSIDTAATLILTAMDNASEWELAYGKANTQIENMRHITVTSETTKVGNLLLNSRYEVYARSICGVGDTSAWAGPFEFVTPLGLTYTAPFNGTLSDWSKYTGNPDSIFNGATLSTIKGSGGWQTSTNTTALSGARIYCSQSSSEAYWIVSPVINMMPQDGSKGIWLSFDAALTSGSTSSYSPTNVSGHTFMVAISEDEGRTWQRDNAILWSGDTLHTDYIYSEIPEGKGTTYHLDITKFAGKKICVALIQGASSTGLSCIHIKNLELAEYSTPCWGIDSYTALPDGNRVHFTITERDSTGTAWQYAYGKSGYVPSTEDAVTVYSRNFSVDNLPSSSVIDIYLRSLCGASDTSAWVGPYSITTPIGIPFYEALTTTSSSSNLPSGWTCLSPSSYSTGWTSSQRWTLKNGTYIWGDNHASTNNYSTNKSMLVTPLIDLASISNPVLMTFDLALTAYNSSSPATNLGIQSFEILVSTDGGKTFDEPLVVWGTGINVDYEYSSIPSTGENYTVDLSEYLGESIMVGFYANSTSGDNDLHIRNVRIDTLNNGQTYCSQIRRMTVIDSTFHSATIRFRGGGVENALAIEYVCLPEDALFNTSKSVRIDTSITTITGLSSSNTYAVYARSQCSDSTWTLYNGPFIFHTVECSNVTGIEVIEASFTDIVANVVTPDAESAYGYKAYITRHGQPLQENEAVFFNSKRLHFTDDFDANSLYDIYVQKMCEPTDSSEWSGPYSVRTPYSVPFEESFAWHSWNSDWTRYSGSLKGTMTTTYSGWSYGYAGTVFDSAHAYINTYEYSYSGYDDYDDYYDDYYDYYYGGGYGGYGSSSSSSTTKTYTLASPEIDLRRLATGQDLYLSFDAAVYNTSTYSATNGVPNNVSDYDNITFGVAVQENDVWYPVYRFAQTNADHPLTALLATGEHFIINLSEYSGSVIKIGFYAEWSGSTSSSMYIHLANALLDTTAIQCERIQSIAINNVDLNSARISYSTSEGSLPETTVIEIAKDASFEQVVLLDTIHNSFIYQAQNLEPSTTYYVHLKTECVAGESPWSSRTSFRTNYGLPYMETFDETQRYQEWTYASDTTSRVFRTGTLNENAGTRYWSRSTSHADIMPTAHPEMNIYSVRSGWLISPVIDLTPNANEGMLLSFDLALCKYSGGGVPDPSVSQSFYVVVSEDEGATWQRSNATSWLSNGTGDFNYSELGITPRKYIVDMSLYAGKKIKIGFCGESVASGGDNYIMFDNVELFPVQSHIYTDTICKYEDYEQGGILITADELELGENRLTYISDDKTEISIFNLYVRDMPTTEFAATICEGEEFTGYGFENMIASVSGKYSRIIERAGECDSLVTLNLTVIPIARVMVEDTLCDGSVVTINGRSYYNNAIVVDTLSSAVSGCDSIVTYYLTFSGDAVLHEEVDVVICAGQRYRDGVFSETEPGTYYETTASSSGCDSIITLHLYVADAEGYIYDTIHTEELPYSFQGKQLLPRGATGGNYTFEVVSANEGCSPSLKVHVITESGLSDIAVHSLSIAPNPVHVGQDIRIVSDVEAGQDFHATVYNAVGQEVYTIEHYSTTLPAIYTSGIYLVRIQTGKSVYEGKLLVK